MKIFLIREYKFSKKYVVSLIVKSILKARISELKGSPGEVVDTPLTIACKNGTKNLIEMSAQTTYYQNCWHKNATW